jgi:hypothetical protein
MARSTVHYADNDTNSILKKLHNKLRPAGTPVQRVEYIIELLLRIFEDMKRWNPHVGEVYSGGKDAGFLKRRSSRPVLIRHSL